MESLDSTNSVLQNVRRQKSWDMLDQNAIAYARQHKNQPHQVSADLHETSTIAYCLILFLIQRPVSLCSILLTFLIDKLSISFDLLIIIFCFVLLRFKH